MLIEKGIPFPSVARRGVALYPLADLKVGDSFAVPLENGRNACVAAARFKTKHPGWDYASRTIPEESCYRVWRTA